MDTKNTKPTGKTKELKKMQIVLAVLLAVFLILVGLIIWLFVHDPKVEHQPSFPTGTEHSDTDASVEPYTRKEGYYTFLIAGVDDISMSTDVLMLASLDSVNKEIHIVQIPRDTFINNKVGGYRNINHVNSIFTVEYNYQRQNNVKTKQAREAAMRNLSEKLSESLCINIDEYVLMNTSAFRTIVDAVGGVEFDVPFDMFYEDPEQDLYIDLKKGFQLLDGRQCEGLIRYRAGYVTGDMGRLEMRASFMKAMFEQVKNKIGVEALIKMVTDKNLMGQLTTSVSVTDMAAYLRMVYQVRNGKMEIRTIAGSVLQNPNTGVWAQYYLNKKGALRDINQCLNVYQNDIAEEIFDQKGFYTDKENSKNAFIHEYYSADFG